MTLPDPSARTEVPLLRRMVAQHGSQILRSPRLKGYLADYLAECSDPIKGPLIFSLQFETPSKVLRMGPRIVAANYNRLVLELTSNGLKVEAARRTIDAWALAVGHELPDTSDWLPPSSSSVPPAPPQTTPPRPTTPTPSPPYPRPTPPTHHGSQNTHAQPYPQPSSSATKVVAVACVGAFLLFVVVAVAMGNTSNTSTPRSCELQGAPQHLAMQVGEQTNLPRTVSDSSGVERDPARWVAADRAIASVSTDGSLRALAPGTTTLVAYFCDTSISVPLSATAVVIPERDAGDDRPPDPPLPPYWQRMLFSSTCESPCFGGSACSTTDEAKASCHSGVTCLLGSGQEPLELSSTWGVHLSAVLDVGQEDPCHKGGSLWVCRQGTDQCIAQTDACENAKSTIGFSNATIPVVIQELVDRKFVLDVRAGGSAGLVLATTRPLPSPVRAGLCDGFGVLVPDTQTITGASVDGPPRITKVTYLLLPAERTAQPQAN